MYSRQYLRQFKTEWSNWANSKKIFKMSRLQFQNYPNNLTYRKFEGYQIQSPRHQRKISSILLISNLLIGNWYDFILSNQIGVTILPVSNLFAKIYYIVRVTNEDTETFPNVEKVTSIKRPRKKTQNFEYFVWEKLRGV